MEALSDANLTALIRPTLGPGDSLEDNIHFLRSAAGDYAHMYTMASNFDALLSMVNNRDPVLRSEARMAVINTYVTTGGTVAEALEAARVTAVTEVVRALLSTADAWRQHKIDNRVCTLHPGCEFYAGHAVVCTDVSLPLPIVTMRSEILYLHLSLADEIRALCMFLDNLRPIDKVFRACATIEELQVAIKRVLRDPILQIDACTQAKHAWTTTQKMKCARVAALEQVLHTAVVQA